MKINYNLIEKIFNMKVKIKNKNDKIKLSNYTDYIPMYDIYSDNIYPISSLNINYRLVECHYRFINDEIKQWIINKKNKTDDPNLKQKYNNNLIIIDNYDIDVLEKTSYETLYRYSPDLGLSISICKRNSFNPFSTHLTPYYTKTELIQLGLNNKTIKKIEPSSLVDKELHYKICKKVSKNDISNETILNHMDAIIKNKCIGWVVFYSMTGSYLFNKILRNSQPINQYMYDGLKMIIDTMNSVSLPNNYYFYRFVWDDSYIKDLKIGSIFEDNGFMSTTRDPFYSPGIKMDFGLILIRINVPKHINGMGLLIENFSMFPKEQEYLIQPLTKFKLIAKDMNASYHHIDAKFEKLIKKRYEFDTVSIDLNMKKLLKILDVVDNNLIPSIDIDNINLDGHTRIDLFSQFIERCDKNGQYYYNDMIFIAEWFDSTTSYQHLYYNKTKDGLIHNCYKDGNIVISIECGEKLVINYSKMKCYYDNNTIIEIDTIIAMYCKIFKYENAIVFFDYHNFTEFKDNYITNTEYLYNNMYCHTIYNYIKNKTKNNLKYYKFEYGFWKLDNIIKMKVPETITNKLPKTIDINKLTWGKLFIIIIEEYFYMYNRMEEWCNTYCEDLFKNNYYIFNALSFLKINGYSISDIPNFKHVLTIDKGDVFRIVYDESTRRVDL
jgi:hypothetical protein